MIGAKNLPYKVKVYFFGSRFKGNADSNSDVDIALEFLDPTVKQKQVMLWFDNHEMWEKELSSLLGLKADLELYENEESPNLKKYLNKSSAVIFENTV